MSTSSDRPNHLLVTGAAGFVGPYLLREALERWPDDARVTAGVLKTGVGSQTLSTRVDERQLDVTDRLVVNQLIASIRPTHVVHLAGISHVPTASNDPTALWNLNIMGTLNMLEAVRKHAPDAIFLFVSSSEVYGRAFQSNKPLDETASLRPRNAYAASKAAAELMVSQYAEYGLRVINARPFNHIGPGQTENFVASAFASQIARIELGQQQPELQVGNLDAIRDFLDVRDVVCGYFELLDNFGTFPNGASFNIASGVGHSIRELLDALVARSSHHFEIAIDQNRLRPSDTPFAIGDASRIRSLTGWTPKYDWVATLEQVLDYWRFRHRSGVAP